MCLFYLLYRLLAPSAFNLWWHLGTLLVLSNVSERVVIKTIWKNDIHFEITTLKNTICMYAIHRCNCKQTLVLVNEINYVLTIIYNYECYVHLMYLDGFECSASVSAVWCSTPPPGGLRGHETARRAGFQPWLASGTGPSSSSPSFCWLVTWRPHQRCTPPSALGSQRRPGAGLLAAGGLGGGVRANWA